MPITPADLVTIPLFRNITQEHLEELIQALEQQTFKQGTVLFQAGSAADFFMILVNGEVSIRDGEEERHRLRAITPVGEVGAVAGLKRKTTAVAATDATVLSASTQTLLRFFEKRGDVAFPFYHNMVALLADKVRRDQRRLDEMRQNIVATQKSMKRMREALLEGEDTPMHKQLFEELEQHIEQNRRAHYLVEPVRAMSTKMRLDSGHVLPIAAMSTEWVHVDISSDTPPQVGSSLSAVLLLDSTEVPISGTVDQVDRGVVVLRLDLLMEEYLRKVEDHLTGLQMLDTVL